MPEYQLYYFNARARGEGIRWLFSLAGVPFEDIRIERKDWPEQKQKMPFGYIPVLSVDGEMLSESQTIGRYLANKFGYAGKTDWEKALADQFVDLVYELLSSVRPVNRAKTEETRNEARKVLVEERAPQILGILEKRLELNNTGYLVGDSLTWADVYLAAYLDGFVDRISPEFGQMLMKCPKVNALLNNVRSLPPIAAFIATRPVTQF